MIKIIYHLWTDGSCSGNGKTDSAGGWGAVLVDDRDNILDTMKDFHLNTTNNRMELSAVINGLEKYSYLLEEGLNKIIVHSDSAYLINCYKNNWWKNWVNSNWINSSRKPVLNKDLWERLIPFFKNERISWDKVKGHVGVEFNEMADSLARSATEEGKSATSTMSVARERKIKVFILNGYPRAGKDTFIQMSEAFLADKNWKVINYSSVDFVKEVATFCGWDGTKTPSSREFLCLLKDLLTNWEDIPNKKILEKINREIDLNKEDNLVFYIAIREPSEIKKLINSLQKELNITAETIFIRRKPREKSFSNHADKEVENYNYSYYIPNEKTIEELKDEVKFFCTNNILNN